MVQKIVIFIVSVLFFTILYLFVKFLYVMSWLNNLKIDYTITPINVISLIFSSVLTIWIGWYISKRLTEQRFEKEFLIRDLNSIETEIHYIESVFNSSTQVDISFVASKGNNIQLLKERFSATLKLMKISSFDDKKLNEKTNALFTQTTNFDSPQILTSDIDIQLINQKCSDVILETRNLIIQINNR